MAEEKVVVVTAIVNDILRVRSKSTDEVKTVLEDILIKAQEVFGMISEFQKQFISDDTRPMDFYYNVMDNLTGCYMFLTPIVSMLDALVDNRSLNYYHMTKLQIQKTGEKFTSAPIEREADQYVTEERYYLAVFSGFLDACKQGIQTCRTRIREIETEKDLNK